MAHPPIDIVCTPPKSIANHSSATVTEVLNAFHQLRAAVAGLFETVGVDPTKTRESARVLNLNRGLAWRLTRVVRAQDPATVISDVPGRQSMAKFIESCQLRGATQDQLAQAAAAIEQFERAVTTCSGDRKTLAMMMANLRDSTARGERERARRKLFEGACSVWGVQAQVRFVTVFLFPAPDDPTKLDAGHVTGYVDFRRLSSRPWPMSYEAVHNAQGVSQQISKRPLDPSGDDEGQQQLLNEFCSPAAPQLTVQQRDSYKSFDLPAGPVGNQSLTTCVFGSYLQHISDRHPPAPDTSGFMVLLQTPVERVIFDLFVHTDLGVATPARTHLLDRLAFRHDNREEDFDEQALPLPAEPFMLPPGIAGAVTPHIPWYPRLLASVTERIAQPMESFVGSRVEMTYPPIATTLSRRIDLEPRPAS